MGYTVTNSPWPGIIKFFPARESLVAGTGKPVIFFYSAYIPTSHPLHGNVSVVCHAESLLLQASHEAMLNKITKNLPCALSKRLKFFLKKLEEVTEINNC